MGVVYLAHYSELKRDVALKVLREEASGDAMRMQRFKREAQVLASLIPLRLLPIPSLFVPIKKSSCLI
jgi:serine/threonine protein kinase